MDTRIDIRRHAPPARYKPHGQSSPPDLSLYEVAARQFPAFDWQGYREAKTRMAFAHPHNRMGRNRPVVADDPRTEVEKLTDQALVSTGDALVSASAETGIKTKDELKRAIIAAYSRTNLPHAVVNVAFVLCWELGLSPNPALGHVHIFEVSGKWTVMIGTHGLTQLARRDHEFILRESRLMTDEERTRYGLAAGDVGVMQGIIDMREIKPMLDALKDAFKVGVMAPIKLDEMLATFTKWHPGIWRAEARVKDGKPIPDNIPASWTSYQVAEKRARMNALRNLGLSANVGKRPTVDGADYNAEDGSYTISVVSEAADAAPESAPAAADPVEVIEGIFAKQVAEDMGDPRMITPADLDPKAA